MRKGKATRPFRPPRQSVDRSVHAEPTHQTNPEPQVILAGDSDEPTQFGLVGGAWLVKETQELGAETTKDQIDTVLVNHEVQQKEKLQTTAASPNVSEFEEYLEGLHGQKDSLAVSLNLPATKPAHLTKDEWWETVLRAEQDRVKNLEERLVPVDEMFLDDCSSEDDDIPIVKTLPTTPAKAKKIKKAKLLWSYETVEEPTGVRSNYWDAQAPSMRTTKKLAKEKIQQLTHVAEQTEGSSIHVIYITFMFLRFAFRFVDAYDDKDVDSDASSLDIDSQGLSFSLSPFLYHCITLIFFHSLCVREHCKYNNWRVTEKESYTITCT